jgi:hypothetical protein
MRLSASADTRNVAASMYKSCSTWKKTSRPPATSGPATVAAAKLAWIRPFAVTRSAWSTRLGTAPNCAASKKIESVPAMKITTMTHQTLSAPSAAATGTAATVVAASRSTVIISRRRSVRSVQAPMISPNSRWGTANSANVAAR